MYTVFLTHEAKMTDKNPESQIIVLFDEQGTPTFQPERETDWFLGVTVTYDLADDERILSSCSELFGLSNQKPLKNNRISNSRAERISALAAELPLEVIINSVKLANDEFQQAVRLFEQLGNLLRARHREVGERNIAQILHSQIVDECIPHSIFGYVERHMTTSAFLVHIDDWSIPRSDVGIYLQGRTQSIQEKVNTFYEEQGPNLRVRVPPIALLDEDSPRKRLVNVIASATSRSFMREGSARLSQVPFHTLLANHVNRYEDITQATIDFIRHLMDHISRNPLLAN